MSTYLISYDLHKPARLYCELHDAIKELANGWWHGLQNVWLVNSALSAAEITDELIRSVDPEDEVLVISVGADWATLNLKDANIEWLRAELTPGLSSTQGAQQAASAGS